MLTSVLHRIVARPWVYDLAQTVAGAISTGTHGSGKNSLSHYVEGLRLAAYDEKTGRARIFEITEGPELSVARCSLGCMGVIVSSFLNVCENIRTKPKMSVRTSARGIPTPRKKPL